MEIGCDITTSDSPGFWMVNRAHWKLIKLKSVDSFQFIELNKIVCPWLGVTNSGKSALPHCKTIIICAELIVGIVHSRRAKNCLECFDRASNAENSHYRLVSTNRREAKKPRTNWKLHAIALMQIDDKSNELRRTQCVWRCARQPNRIYNKPVSGILWTSLTIMAEDEDISKVDEKWVSYFVIRRIICIEFIYKLFLFFFAPDTQVFEFLRLCRDIRWHERCCWRTMSPYKLVISKEMPLPA